MTVPRSEWYDISSTPAIDPVKEVTDSSEAWKLHLPRAGRRGPDDTRLDEACMALPCRRDPA